MHAVMATLFYLFIFFVMSTFKNQFRIAVDSLCVCEGESPEAIPTVGRLAVTSGNMVTEICPDYLS